MSKPLLIIAEDIEGEALATLVVNKLRGGLIDSKLRGCDIVKRARRRITAALRPQRCLLIDGGNPLRQVPLEDRAAPSGL